MSEKEIETFYPESREAWRRWLMAHHETHQSIWLICYKQKANLPTVSWSDTVDEALCFGWIDSTRVTIDEDRFRQFFTRRKPKSVWSKINKDKVARLTEAGLMMPAGQRCVDIAIQNGSWNAMDEVEEMRIPEDLVAAFPDYPGSQAFFESLSKSAVKMILYRLAMAKRPETRQKRIRDIALNLAAGKKPTQF